MIVCLAGLMYVVNEWPRWVLDDSTGCIYEGYQRGIDVDACIWTQFENKKAAKKAASELSSESKR
ncbi:hypothetical protein MW290_32200 (plasmid) [Aquincola tertiaricarbonis]|uniref:Uncharacterized protein n=1 Tax=Aquincola tertiaricarbonis TaxID=391953 RepID=A0ABY4SKV4_AQUTE|nr:hypothetical protein [Aquincola tertiaricarbonis]URI11990.1 hypothetical protein MW290_32200 [Aquincola tertiaricarbonis]